MGTRDDAPDGPRVAASLVTGLRHLLIEHRVWDPARAVLLRRHPDVLKWVENDLAVDPTRVDWVVAAHYGDLMDAILEVVGADRTFALGRERFERTAKAGAFAPVVRSWARSFGDDPQEFLRLAIHAWSAQTRNLGVLESVESRLGRARFVLRDAGPPIRDSVGWRRFISGYGTGMLDLIQREGFCAVELDVSGHHVEITFDYRELGTPAEDRE